MEAGRLKQIEEIYHAALEIAPADRESFFLQHCGADESLRREVESLLSFEESSDDFLDRPPESLAAEMFVEQEKQANLTGREFGHYKIKKLLGRGGMGEVYLAEDGRLKRRVALKILPTGFAADASRRNRFEQEARAASALNHPNILTVHEFGVENGIHFLATEYIEGETLRERMSSGELPLPDALDIAAQAAFALSAAHALGIVHRDIKPENIMIRADGIVKVLDFGIAKLLAAPFDTESETIEKISTKTKPGALLGTLSYMSPEQIRGESLDVRSDIFSLGVCLYEMLTGGNPFQQATTGDVIASILKENPSPVTQENAAFPAELERILSKSLKKKRDERYQTSRDFLLDVKSLRREIEFSESTERTGNKKSLTTNAEEKVYTTNVESISGFSFPKWLPVFLIAVLLIGGAWWFFARRNTANDLTTPLPNVLQTVEVVNWRSTPGEVYSTGAFSPDAKMVAFASTKTGAKNIWVKQLSGGEAVQITKDDFANQNPIWSPDGDELAFISQRGGATGIWRMPSFGGSPIYISAIKDGGAILRRWAKSGAIYYESEGNLFKLDFKTTASTALTEFDSAETNVSSFSVSPDETQVAFVRFENEKYTILTMPFGGTAKQIADGADEIRNVVWHTDGRRVLYSQNTNGIFQIFAADGDSKPAQITFGERDSLALDASADGSKILYGASKEESDIWRANVETGEESSFASDINSELWAAVAPDGKQVAFQSIKDLSQGDKIFGGAILTKRIGADESPVQLAANAFLSAYSPDNSRLAFGRIEGESYHLWTVKVAGGEEKQLTTGGGMPSIEFTVLPYNRTLTADFSWSPDGSKIAYVADELPRNVRAVDANDASRNVQLTDNTDANLFLACPLWSANGKRVAYSSRTNKADTDRGNYFGAWIIDFETKAAKNVRQTENFQRLLGFSASGKELLLAETKRKSPTELPTNVTIIEINIETGEQRQIAQLNETYLYNIRLSADKKMLAYASHRDDKDNIWVARFAASDAARKITSNNDARLYFSALAWSPDNRAIYFGKQTRYSLLSMVSNFK